MTTTSRWLSEGAEVLVAELAAQSASSFHCDVLIVGSGYGGSVAAARLAGAANEDEPNQPISVMVLERGREYLPGMFPSRWADIAGHARFTRAGADAPSGRSEGLFDVFLGADVQTLVGSGLGGGSLINANVMERPVADAFNAHWPAGIRLPTLDPFYGRVEKVLHCAKRPGPAEGQPPKVRALGELGTALGATARLCNIAVSFAAARNSEGIAMEPCLDCGDCVSGCNYHAKNTLDTNYLVRARRRGARLFTGATVQTVLPHNRGFIASFVFTDPRLCPADRGPYELRAQRVVLAAGALGSTSLLMRSKSAGLAPMSAKLGQRFSTNGDMIAVAYGQKITARSSAAEHIAPKARKVGATILSMLQKSVPGEALPIVVQELAIPAALRRLFEETATTTSMLQRLTQSDWQRHKGEAGGIDPLAVDDAAIERTSVYAVMGDDGARGSVVSRGASVDIVALGLRELDLFKRQIELLREGQKRGRALGGHVAPNPIWRAAPAQLGDALGANAGPIFTVHPLGGCPMADRAQDGVVNDCGQLFCAAEGTDVYPALVVLDGAIVPTALGINPALTIAALAEHSLDRLIPQWNMVEWEARDPNHRTEIKLTERPTWTTPHQTQPAPTEIELGERMTGKLSSRSAGIDHEVALELQFERIADIALFVRTLPRIARVSGEIALTGTQGRQTWAVTGTVDILAREASGPIERAVRALRAFMFNRGWREMSDWSDGTSWTDLIRGFWALATQVGEARTLRYDLTVLPALNSKREGLRAGDRLVGVKRLAYTKRSNPWWQLRLADFALERDGQRHAVGRLEVDLRHFAKKSAPLLRVVSQQDMPNALGDLGSAALFIARLLVKIHFWSFRKPDGYLRSEEPGQPDLRLPRPLEGAGLFTEYWLPIAGRPEKIRLARYEGSGEQKRPVLLVHGYGASGSTFAHPAIGENLVQSLSQRGFDVWVVDLRTSIGLAVAHEDWLFDDVAVSDIPAAVEFVRSSTGAECVDVVGHCIGAAMLTTALLRHETVHTRIGAVVLSQVAPIVELSPFNVFRGYLASYLRQFLGVNTLSGADRDVKTPLEVDRLLSTFPYPEAEWDLENPRKIRAKAAWQAVRHRTDGIFGQTFPLANVAAAMLQRLDDVYGFVRIQSYAQTIHYARTRLLVDAKGHNREIAATPLRQRFDRPLLLVHGERNEMFHPSGAQQTKKLLDDVFGGVDLPRRDIHIARGLGHQDSMIGNTDANRRLFERIGGFLQGAQLDRPAQQPAPDVSYSVLPPWIGPILGWLRLDSQSEWDAPRKYHLRVQIVANPARASARGLAVIPITLSGARYAPDLNQAAWLPAHAESSRLTWTNGVPIDVTLNASLVGRYTGFVAAIVHDDLPFRHDPNWEPQDSQPDTLFPQNLRLPEDSQLLRNLEEFVMGGGIDVESSLFKIQEALAAADTSSNAGSPPRPARFALASCQYPPSLLDALPAQRSLRRFAARLDQASADAPQFTLLVGDQVYVDETAGVFEPAASASDKVDVAYERTFRMKAWRAVASRRPVYMMLDDHEIVDNWEPDRPRTPNWDTRFHKYQRAAGPPRISNGAGAFSMHPAGMPFLVLDTRSQREVRSSVNSAARIMHQTQLQLLYAWLQMLQQLWPTAPKFVVSPSPVFPWGRDDLSRSNTGHYPYAIRSDSWSGYPQSLIDLLTFIATQRIQRVVFLSGDAHLHMVARATLTLNAEQTRIYSVISSGLYSPYPFANTDPSALLLQGSVRLAGLGVDIESTMVEPADGFALLSVENPNNDWSLRAQFDLATGVQSVSVF